MFKETACKRDGGRPIFQHILILIWWGITRPASQCPGLFPEAVSEGLYANPGQRQHQHCSSAHLFTAASASSSKALMELQLVLPCQIAPSSSKATAVTFISTIYPRLILPPLLMRSVRYQRPPHHLSKVRSKRRHGWRLTWYLFNAVLVLF